MPPAPCTTAPSGCSVWLTPSERRPAGIATDGLPVGVQIVGPYLYDRTVIAFAWHRLPHRRIHAAAGIRGRDSLTVVPAYRTAGGLVISRLAVVDDQGTALRDRSNDLHHLPGSSSETVVSSHLLQRHRN